MTWTDFVEEIESLGLQVKVSGEGVVEIANPKYANPLLFFKESNKGEAYNGNVTVKAINSFLFTSRQITKAIDAANAYLKPTDK